MAQKVFYSFHFERDSHRVSQVRNMGVVEGQPLLSSNEWEDVKEGGDSAIEDWIDEQMKGKKCAVVLIGSKTAGRHWVEYEIKKAWEAGKGVLGVYIHGLKNLAGEQDAKGANPFKGVSAGDESDLSTVVKTYDPPYTTSTYVYDHIKDNLADWIEKAIEARA
jgi:hypothetical protein